MYSGKSNSFLIIAGSNRPTITLPIPNSLAANIMWSQTIPMSKSPEHLLSKGRTSSFRLSRQTIRTQVDPKSLYAFWTFERFSGSRTTIILCGWRLQALGAKRLTDNTFCKSSSGIAVSLKPLVVHRCFAKSKNSILLSSKQEWFVAFLFYHADVSMSINANKISYFCWPFGNLPV